MPPRVPSNSDLQTSTSDESMEMTHPSNDMGTMKSKSQEAETALQPSNARKVTTTYHWEMNLYCALALGFLYYWTPHSYQKYWHFVFGLLALDAARYYYQRGSMAGVPYTLPLVNLLAMLMNPERFWAELGAIAMASRDGLCANTMVGCQMIFCTDPEVCRSVFTNADHYGIYAHPNAIWLFDPKNIIYLSKDTHKKIRAVLTPALFSDAALVQYSIAQEAVCRQALQKLAQECERTNQAFDAMVAFRSLGAMSSQEAFLGPYLTPELRGTLENDILVFTLGFLSFPFPYAGGLKRGLDAKFRIEKAVLKMVPLAREYILANNQPRCLLEHWCQAIIQTAKERGCGITEVHGCTDDDISRSVLDFLFAAQDATNSGLVYTLDVMQAHPDVFEKCCEEVLQQCGKSSVASHVRDSLPYTNKVANQLLHHKPPVPMCPHLCKADTTLAGHSIAKGTVVIPSITYSCRSTGHSLEFLPERTDQDQQFLKSMVFGAGQHKCPGRRYAESLLTVFLAVLAQEYKVERVGPRPGPDDFIFFPTLFPRDSNFILRKRE